MRALSICIASSMRGLANLYRASDAVQINDTDFLSAAGAVLKTVRISPQRSP